QDPHPRAGQRGAYRIHAVAHPARPVPEGGGGGGDDLLAVLLREHLHHRRDLRPFRRSDDLLTAAVGAVAGVGTAMSAAASGSAVPEGAAGLAAALERMGLMTPGEAPVFTPLSGGVSSDIWRVALARGPVCVKRALP